ncbi:MAG: prenyltransferase/squalene oxidase repeat-containing protein, partial [Terriglobia bacterium]
MRIENDVRHRLQNKLLECETPEGGWSFYPQEAQSHLEPTCLSLLALRYCAEPRVIRGLEFLLHSQNPNGSWPAFAGDDQEGCWVTALAVLTLNKFRACPNAVERGVNWLLDSKGKESHWLWKWKFRTSDTHVRFDPDKFGWPWMPETNSWVVPTSFALLALTQCFPGCRPSRVRVRIARGIEMLLDRVCPNGGWNAGNGVVYGVPLGPHLEATAIALLALRGQVQNPIITASLS